MGTMPPSELLKLWKLEHITVEMAVGHILQNLITLHTTVEIFDASLCKLQGNVDDLIAHTEMKPRSKGRKKSFKGG